MLRNYALQMLQSTKPPLPAYAQPFSSSSSSSSSSNSGSSSGNRHLNILLLVIQLLTTHSEHSVSLLAADVLQLCLDVNVPKTAESLEARIAKRQADIAAAEVDVFNQYFYSYCMPWLVENLYVVGEQSERVCTELVTVLNMLVGCVQEHGKLMCAYTRQYNLGAQMLPLLQHHTVSVKVST
jgi:hypothetical protein